MSQPDVRRYLLCLGAGLALPLAFAPFDWYWLAPLSYAALFYAWRVQSPWAAFRLGLVYGCASFGAGTYWTYIAVRVFGEAPIALAAFLTVGLVVVLALFVATAGYVAARWWRTTGAVGALAVLPAAFMLFEWLRGWAFSGFGWLSAGYSQTSSWLASAAPVAGLHGVSWLVLLSAGALALLVTVVVDARERRAARLAAPVAALAAIWSGAALLDRVDWTAPTGRTLDVALVQGAFTQDLRWDPEQLRPALERYADLTAGSVGSDLIVWPEAAIPEFYERLGRYLAEIRALAAAGGGTVILGILRVDRTHAEPGIENGLVALTEPEQFYVKRHLVPFGEYFPVPSFVRSWMRLMSLPYTDIEPGDPAQPPLDVAGERIAVTICYEDVFGAEQLHSLPEATLLVNVSNDAWFGDSIAPHQHLQIAQMRAAEAGRYLLRATNTGVSAVIDPRGRVLETLPQFAPGVLRRAVEGHTGATPYARVGNYAAIPAGCLTLLAVLVAARRRPRAEPGAAR